MTQVKDKENNIKRLGSFTGMLCSIGIGFILYFILKNISKAGSLLSYNDIVKDAGNNISNKFIWFIMNFTEAQFFAGVLASLGIILGGFIAWRLNVKKSRYAGFDICYGTNLWPWVFASQVLSLALAIFLLNYTSFFNSGEYSWLPTFITVVGAPPAVMLLYGPNYKALLTGSILGGIMGFPIAFWIMKYIIPILHVPGVVSNVFTMAISGLIICQICKILPWMNKTPLKPIDNKIKNLTKEQEILQMSKPSWFIRRVFADFSEAQFYGNEIAGLFVIIGVVLDWILNMNHGAYGSGAIPAILLSQFVGSAVGIWLYFYKYIEDGWYATYVPVVSVGPACVLMFGASIQTALFAGILGGIIGAPLADYLLKKLPDHIHGTVANVTSMGITTIIVSIIMQALPWF